MSLESLIKAKLDELASVREIYTPYDLSVASDLADDICICAGSIPKIIISLRFILTVLQNKDDKLLTKRLQKTLDVLPKMHHSLSLVPRYKAIALKQEAKAWTKTLVPDLVTVLSERFLTVTHSVTVTDTITNTSITLTGNDPKELKQQAIQRLSKIVLENEDVAELYEALDYANSHKEVKPIEVRLSGQNEDRLTYDYGDK